MWTSTNFKTYAKQFDFTSADLGKPTFTALKVDDTDFINNIEGLDGEIEDDQIFQTILCSSCGFYQCEYGNWIAIRQSKDYVFFIPAFEELKEKINKEELAPPNWFKEKGTFCLSKAEFENFKKLVPELDKLKEINRISTTELLALYKLDTPHKMFGDYPEFTGLRKNHILAVSDLDNETAFEILESKLENLKNSNDYELSTLTENDNIVSIFLDDISTTEWKALCKTEDDYELLLGGEFKITGK